MGTLALALDVGVGLSWSAQLCAPTGAVSCFFLAKEPTVAPNRTATFSSKTAEAGYAQTTSAGGESTTGGTDEQGRQGGAARSGGSSRWGVVGWHPVADRFSERV